MFGVQRGFTVCESSSEKNTLKIRQNFGLKCAVSLFFAVHLKDFLWMFKIFYLIISYASKNLRLWRVVTGRIFRTYNYNLLR